MSSLTLAVLRNMILVIIFAYILAIPLNMGERGVWWGIVAGDIVGGIVAYVWARFYIKRLQDTYKGEVTS